MMDVQLNQVYVIGAAGFWLDHGVNAEQQRAARILSARERRLAKEERRHRQACARIEKLYSVERQSA